MFIIIIVIVVVIIIIIIMHNYESCYHFGSQVRLRTDPAIAIVRSKYYARYK
jgi:uncharacterized membrane protein